MNRFLMIACTLSVTIATASAGAIKGVSIVDKIDYPRYAGIYHTGFNAVVKKVGPAVHPPIIPNPVVPLTTIFGPVSYGFGATIVPNLPKLTSVGHWSLPWDHFTHSYGGWVPLTGPLLNQPYVMIYSKKYVNGKVHRWSTGPIPLYGKTLVLKTKH